MQIANQRNSQNVSKYFIIKISNYYEICKCYNVFTPKYVKYVKSNTDYFITNHVKRIYHYDTIPNKLVVFHTKYVFKLKSQRYL